MVFQSQMNSKTTVSEIKHLIMGLTEEECAEALKKTAPSAANTESGKEAQHNH